MAVNPKHIAQVPVIPSDPIWRLSVVQYHQMIEAGVFTDDDPVELLEGWLVPKMPKNPYHRLVTKLIFDLLFQMIPEGWYVDAQEPITTADSEPEPDVVVVRGEPRKYIDHHPRSMDIGLVIEVADSTLKRDRELKKRLYARAAILNYWIINLPEKQVEVYFSPTGPGPDPDYLERKDYFLTDEIPLILDGIEIGRIAVQKLFS